MDNISLHVGKGELFSFLGPNGAGKTTTINMLTGFDNLCFCAALYGIRKKERKKRARELLETFGLSDAAGRKFADYSKG